MNKVAYCGLLCEECEIYKATIANDNTYKAKIAKKFSNPNYPLSVKDINCYGCSGNDKAIFKFCGECEIRLCGIEKFLDNCSLCSEFPCKQLSKPFEQNPENKKRLEELRNK